ncbi:DNA cytosine methyltransferase [Butyricicoccus sp. 1XD8-22]|nr:DNA cytosine methyltransferase [Butyricicoccus sp. 1XD8-22]
MKKKTIKGSKRGITFSDRALFPIHSKIKYTIDKKQNRLIIALSEKEGQPINWEEKLELASEEKAYLGQVKEASVSRKSTGKEFIPLIDIRSREVLDLFEGYQQLHVTIGEEIVVVTCTNDGESVLESMRGLLRKKKNRKTYVFPKKEFYDVVGVKETDSTEDQILRCASFFSGGGLLDEAFLQAGYDIVFALEKNPSATSIYRYNHGDHVVEGDICDFDTSLMQNAEVIIGGPPCVGFSSANRISNYLMNPNNLLVRKYIEAIKANENAKVFVLENVPQIITNGNGLFAKEILSELSDFDISYGVLSSADFGAPQDRKRAIFIGSKIGHIPLPTPTHTEDNYVTVRIAFEGLDDRVPNQTDYSIPRPETLERMQYIKEGQNWEALPEHLRGNMRKGKTHSKTSIPKKEYSKLYLMEEEK